MFVLGSIRAWFPDFRLRHNEYPITTQDTQNLFSKCHQNRITLLGNRVEPAPREQARLIAVLYGVLYKIEIT